MRFSRENYLGKAKSTLDSHQEQEGEDCFDRLPDDLLLVIFNKVLDARSLVRCLSISKRFNSLIPHVDAIFLSLPRKTPPKKPLFKNLLNNYIPKSIRFLHKIVAPNSKPTTRKVLYYPPNEALKGFKETKSLHLEFPCTIGDQNDESLLKWTAEFGTNLQSCVILGGNSIKKGKLLKNDNLEKENDNGSCKSSSPSQQPLLSDEELMLRIRWMISSLITASARHFMLKRVVGDFPALANVVVSDESKRGKLHIGAEQLAEMRSNSANDESSKELESSLERSVVPDTNMKMWYVPQLELPGSGCMITGATLVVIRPTSDDRVIIKKGSVDDGDMLGGGFDGSEGEKTILGEAVGEMIKMKNTYVMEMTSF
ncbi:F-box protein At1g30200-like [Humulus lupulus]|uniref:F-box protein At1g30200-like n=1 Tax=Humulus lupulus TaxID=3486 RepID=UPI002B41576A|nr:F-box protein At1g30200-like [Humulus lupulus]